jgi:hypothetical protein
MARRPRPMPHRSGFGWSRCNDAPLDGDPSRRSCSCNELGLGRRSIPKVMFVQRTRSVADRHRVTPPREICPNAMCLLTVRAVNRSFRFVPTARVTATIQYCLAAALAKFSGKIVAHEFLFMSNHFLCAAAHKKCYGAR